MEALFFILIIVITYVVIMLSIKQIIKWIGKYINRNNP